MHPLHRRLLGTRRGRATLVAAGVVVVALALTAAAGGFRAAGTTDLPDLPAGRPVDLGRVEVTVIDHLVTDQVETVRLESAGAAAWLVVRARVEAAGDETVEVLPSMMQPPPGTTLAAEPDMEVLLRDGTQLPQAHPGLPEEVAFLWAVRDPADVPDPLPITLLGSESYYSPIYLRDVWAGPEPVARTVVPAGAEIPEVLVEEPW
ncbi:hypothetical protein [Georgenia daeguensis]|uniref:DUF4352 domain-containing protein n=1 Tax=Georgenia daeguensis TaxID=908355 RepID=A0ABP8EX08_9MICO